MKKILLKWAPSKALFFLKVSAKFEKNFINQISYYQLFSYLCLP